MTQQTESTAVVRREKPVDPVVKQFQDMRARGYNTLVPSATILQNLPAHMQVSLDIITISTDPAMKEVFNTGTDSSPALALSKTAVMKIASAAGIQVDPLLTKRLDDRKDRMYCAYQAVVWYTKPDGTRLCFKAEKEYDLHLFTEKITDQKKKLKFSKYPKTDTQIEDLIRKDVLFLREHVASLCETKAILRAIRGVLAIKGSYTPDELKNPFVVPRVTYRLDYNDPMVKARVLDTALGSTAQLYGQQASGELAANVEHMTYLPSPVGMDDDDFSDFGILADPESPRTITVAAESPDAGDGPESHWDEGAQPLAPAVVDPSVKPVAGETAGQPAAEDTGKAKVGKKGTTTEAPPAGPVVFCEDCPTPLTEKQIADAAAGFPAKCNPCIDKDLVGESGAA
jgi:hypothetical protein